MIQLSIQPGTETAKPTKTAASGAKPDAIFAAVLEGRMPARATLDGKLLPGGGKDLPVDPAIAGKPEQAPPANGAGDLARLAAETALLPDGQGAETGGMDTQPDLEGEADGDKADAALDTSRQDIPVVAVILHHIPQAPIAAVPAEETASPPARNGGATPLPAVLPPVPSPGDMAKDRTLPAHSPLPRLAPAARDGEMKLQADPAAALPENTDEPAKPAAQTANAPKDQATMRLPLARQIRIDLAQDAKPNVTSAAAESRGNERTMPASALSPATPLTLGDGAMPAQAHNAARIAAPAPAMAQPHDFGALVDRLVEAREAARPQTVSVDVMHSDFGEVSLRFSHDERGLTVSMANRDPEFARAVGNAMPADRAASGDAMGQNGRRDDGAPQSFSRGASDSSAPGNGGGNGRERRDPQGLFAPIRENAARQAGNGTARNGIFA